MKANASRKRNAGGRPPKFSEPRRPVTVTLPLRTLQQLAVVSPDRARAIVKTTEAALRTASPADRKVEIVEVLPGRSVILVGPSRHLQRVACLHMAEIAPARFLLTIPSGTTLESLELEIADVLEDVGENEPWEKEILGELLSTLKGLRRTQGYSKAEMIFVKTPAGKR